MVFEFKLPDIGEGVHEGEIVEWYVKEGDSVTEDQRIVEVMTDKATVEITSPRTGTIAKILVAAGEVAKVGDVILQIQEGGGAGAAKAGTSAPSAKPAPQQAPASAPPTPTTSVHQDVAPGVKAPAATAAAEEDKTLFDLETDTSVMFRSKRRGTGAQQAAAQQSAVHEARPAGGKALASPAIRREAREKGVDLSQVAGSGPAGRITRQDWTQFLAAGPRVGGAPAMAGPASAAPEIAQWAGEERVPVRGLRKAIFENMRRSEDYAVPFTYWDEFDVTDLVKLRREAGELAKQQGVKLTYLPFIVKAVVAGLKQFPDLNAHVDERNVQLVKRAQFNVGIATATDRGLMVVVVKDADKKSIFEIAAEIDALGEKARSFKASPDDLKGSTFTITSLGKDGGLGATPVINHPEVAILGVHKIEPRAKVSDAREVVVRDCMNLSGSFDHRLIDGHVAAAFVQHVGKLLASPHLLLLGTA